MSDHAYTIKTKKAVGCATANIPTQIFNDGAVNIFQKYISEISRLVSITMFD